MYTKVGEERTWSRKYRAKNELEVNEKEGKLVQGRNHVNIVNKNVLSCDFLCFHFLMRESCPIFLSFFPFFVYYFCFIFYIKLFSVLKSFVYYSSLSPGERNTFFVCIRNVTVYLYGVPVSLYVLISGLDVDAKRVLLSEWKWMETCCLYWELIKNYEPPLAYLCVRVHIAIFLHAYVDVWIRILLKIVYSPLFRSTLLTEFP